MILRSHTVQPCFPHQFGSRFSVAEPHTSCSLNSLNMVQTHSSNLSWCLGKVLGQRIPQAFVTSPAETPESGSFLLSHRLLLSRSARSPVRSHRAPSPWPGTGSGPCRGRRPFLHPGHNLQLLPELPALNVLLSRQRTNRDSSAPG